jgi:hypothetical protein
MSWWKIWGKKNLAASVQVSNLVNQLRGIEGEVSSQVDKGAATQSIQEFVNSSKKVSAQARVCLYVTHVCLQNSDEILPLLRKFENLDNQIRNRKKMDSVRYVRDQAIIWNSLASDFRKFELHTARFSPQDFLNQYGSVEESILKQFEADFSTINSKPISKVGKLTMGSTKNQLTNPSGQAIRQIMEDERKLEQWFELLATELKNLSGLHDDMNKSALTIGGLSGRMGKLARSATSSASAAVESAKGIEKYAKDVLALQTNLQGTVNTLHKTGVMNYDKKSQTIVQNQNNALSKRVLSEVGKDQNG